MLKLIQAAECDFKRITDFYKFVIENTETMPVCCRWIYGLHPTDELIHRYIRERAMYYTGEDGDILSAVAVLPYQEEDYHDVRWSAETDDKDVATVHILCVNPEYQKKGIARQTMDTVTEAVSKSGKKAIRLDALESNLPAQRLYESMGFVRRDCKHWYACNIGWTNFVLYEKQICEKTN